MEPKLIKRHISFIDEYMINGMNATDAYKKVYPKAADDTARKNGSRLLSNADITSEITARQKVTSAKLGITKEQIIQDLIDIKNNTKKDNPQAALKSLEILNKMNGFNEPDKQETKITGLDIKKLLGFED